MSVFPVRLANDKFFLRVIFSTLLHFTFIGHRIWPVSGNLGLYDSAATLYDSAATLYDSAATLYDSAATLYDSAATFANVECIQNFGGETC